MHFIHEGGGSFVHDFQTFDEWKISFRNRANKAASSYVLSEDNSAVLSYTFWFNGPTETLVHEKVGFQGSVESRSSKTQSTPAVMEVSNYLFIEWFSIYDTSTVGNRRRFLKSSKVAYRAFEEERRSISRKFAKFARK